jgi:hypothetical protein
LASLGSGLMFPAPTSPTPAIITSASVAVQACRLDCVQVRLDLDPGVGPFTGPVTAALPLGHDALQAFPADRFEEGPSLADDTRGEHDLGFFVLLDQFLQPFPAPSRGCSNNGS